MVCSLMLGIVLLATMFFFSPLVVSSRWTDSEPNEPVSLYCDFEELPFSKESLTSNVTGKQYTLLHIIHNGADWLSVYTSKPSDEIQDVCMVKWEGSYSVGISAKMLPSGTYVIETGHVENFAEHKTQLKYQFLVIEGFHEPTELEKMFAQNVLLSQIIVTSLLTLALSLVLVPLVGFYMAYYRKD